MLQTRLHSKHSEFSCVAGLVKPTALVDRRATPDSDTPDSDAEMVAHHLNCDKMTV
jgi:hypothetical protein